MLWYLMSVKSIFVSDNFPPPPDLTPRITKTDDQPFSGGGFGDVYRCWYHDNLQNRIGTSHKTQVAVKVFRFRFGVDGDASGRSVKVMRIIYNQ